MINVLLVENSPGLLKSIKQVFQKYESQLNLIIAENGAEAITTLEEEPISVLITDLYVPKVDGLELLAYMSRHHPDTPIIMTAFGSPELMEILANLGIHHYLEKPFKVSALIKAVSEAINKISKGVPQKGLSLNGYLRLLQEEQRTCTLEVVNPEGMQGCFYLIDGRLYDAECSGLQGEDAAIELLSWQKISLNLKGLESEDIPARIHISLKALITKAEELRKTAAPAPEKSPEQAAMDPKKIILQAISQAESGLWKPANKSLAKLLKSNPQISIAWLWLARTSDSLKTIGVALKNASMIAPNDANIKGDIEKLQSAINSGCGEAGSLKHCPFCWAPVIKDINSCHYCNAHLDIHEDFFHSMFFSSKREPNLKIVEESYQRFSKAKARDPKNPHPYFFLAMAHINLNQWEEALEELRQTEKIEPANNPYQKQLEILIDFMNDLESFFTQDDDEQGEEVDDLFEEPQEQVSLIMVVEDSTTTRNIVTKMLQKEGYQVVEARDGNEAIAKFAENKPDLLLLDIILPGMNGHQTLAKMKKKHDLKNIPVIMLTAKDSLIAKLKGKVSGSTEYLTKPFSSDDLIRKIKKVLA